MRFIKENFHDIVKLYVNHIGIMIFSFFTIIAVGAINADSDFLAVLASALSMLFFYVLIYYVVWELGGKDKIRVDSGRKERTPMKGLLLGLCGGIPHFVISILCFIFTLINAINVSANPEYLIMPETNPLGGVCGVLWVIMSVHGSMYQTLIYNGIVTNIIPADNSYAMAFAAGLHMVIPILAALVTHLAYTLGSKDKKILDIFRRR